MKELTQEQKRMMTNIKVEAPVLSEEAKNEFIAAFVEEFGQEEFDKVVEENYSMLKSVADEAIKTFGFNNENLFRNASFAKLKHTLGDEEDYVERCVINQIALDKLFEVAEDNAG